MPSFRGRHDLPKGLFGVTDARPKPIQGRSGLSTFALFDETHSEMSPRRDIFETFDAALDEIQRRAALPWDDYPNRAPCKGWATCGREYAIREYLTDTEPWTFVRAVQVVAVSAEGVTWMPGFDPLLPPS